jgi:hypothetical protein
MSIDGNLNTGVTGAKRASFKMKGPKQILVRLIKQYPTYTEREIELLFNDRLTEADYEVFKTYWYVNHFRALKRSPKMASARPTQVRTRSEIIASIRAKGKEDVKTREDKISVNFTERMDGIYQSILNITFAECASVGGWATKLSGMGKPDQKVGDVLTLEQVKAVFIST